MSNKNIQPLIFAAKTEAKQPGRSQNQDAIRAVVWSDQLNLSGGLFIVADGVGGHKEGSLASETAVTTIHQALESIWVKIPSDIVQATQFLQSHLYQAIVLANEKIYAYAKEQNIRMASTITCVLIYRSLAVIANVGDSRTYLLRSGNLEQITVDHSVVDWLVRQGHLTPEEAVNHPYKNVIMQALGSHETPEADMFMRTLQTGDILVLCSDGIWDTMSDAELTAQLLKAKSLETAVAHITTLAQDNTDDLSLVIAQFRHAA